MHDEGRVAEAARVHTDKKEQLRGSHESAVGRFGEVAVVPAVEPTGGGSTEMGVHRIAAQPRMPGWADLDEAAVGRTPVKSRIAGVGGERGVSGIHETIDLRVDLRIEVGCSRDPKGPSVKGLRCARPFEATKLDHCYLRNKGSA